MRYCLLALAGCLLLGAATQALASPIDLTVVAHNEDLVGEMEVRGGSWQGDLMPWQVLAASDWQQGEDAQKLLVKPRERSTIWLRGTVTNTSIEPIRRWLQLSPWRLEQVNAWLLAPDTGRVLAQAKTGLNVPVSERTVESSRTLVPITLPAGETRQLLIRISSNSRPFLTVKSWKPVAFTNTQASRYQSHSIILASLLTLFVVLLLQWDYRYALIGAWMLATFVLEAEKEGYISFVLFSGLADYAGNIRFTAWILHKALFLVVSVYLLKLHQCRVWRWLPAVVLVTAGVFSLLTFVLNSVDIRNLGVAIDFGFSAIWLMLLPGALQKRNRWQWALLGLVSCYWLTTTYMLLSYTFAFQYTAAFASSRVMIEIAVVLGLLGVYARQKRDRKRYLELQLREQEKAQRVRLEAMVATRTQELRQAVEEADRANAAKSNFLARITHDLRSPLTSILGYNQLLAAEGGRIGEISRVVYASAEHMLNLVNRLIDYARGGSEGVVELADFYLPAFLESIGREASIKARENGNAFQLIKATDLPTIVRSDATYLRQILLNLLDNAAKHTEHGNVELKVACRPRNGQDGTTLVFDVSDDGYGIPLEQQNRLWEPFYQGSGRCGGLGLGLSIVKQLTQQLGAELTLDSEPGRGTRIGFELPVSVDGTEQADVAIIQESQHVLPYFDATGYTAWVVEDAAAIRDFLHAELDGLGFTVRLFANAEAFFGAADAALAAPDLVITDYYLTGASGDAVLAASRRCWPEVAVILLSATQRMHKPALQQGGQDYTERLTKPVHLAYLRRAIASACGCELSMPEALSQEVSQPVSPESAIAVLDTKEKQQLAHFLALGAVTDMVEWTQELATQDSERRGAAATLSSLAEQGRFDTLARLLADTQAG
ncbi:ATP-binding protein [Halomonas piscis]|nr:ATP-binding protein [Halomonas piscis]